MSRAGPSIRRRLLAWLTVLLTLLWGAAAYFTSRSARHEAAEVYDANLAQNARVVASLLRHETAEIRELQEQAARLRAELGADELKRLPLLAELLDEHLKSDEMASLEPFGDSRLPGHPYESRIALLARQADKTVLLRSANAPDFGDATPGFSYVGAGNDRWRVFTVNEPDSGLTVHAGERIELRKEMVRYVTLGTLAPLFAALPLLALLAWFAVGRGLRPLVKLARTVEKRRPDTLDPVDDVHAPREVRALVNSLNRLFGRVRETLDNERRFTADAAHELRTPLSALKTQAQVAQRSVDPIQRAHALAQLVAGADRATHLVEQLLALARSDAGQRAAQFVRVDLAEVAREVLREMAPGAGARRIELELTGGSAQVSGNPDGLRMLLRNLLDNAIRYGGAEGRVAVATGHQDGRPVLRVTDTGPGIAPEQREAMFERFQRGSHAGESGSGLGLSIVQRIADLHGADIVLADGPGGRGLSVTVRFPA